MVEEALYVAGYDAEYGETISPYAGKTGGVIVKLKDLRGVYSYVKQGMYFLALMTKSLADSESRTTTLQS